MSIGETVKRHLVDTRPLAVPAYRRLWIGQAVSQLGSGATVVVVSQQVYDLTRSSLWVGLLGLAHLLPLIVFGLWGGAAADAADRRKVLLAGSLVTWVATLFLLAQAVLGLDQVALLIAAVAVSATGFAVTSPTRGAVIPRLLPAELVPGANALNSLAFSVGAVGGPMAGGVLLAWQGYAVAYAFDALLFSVSLYAALRLPAMRPLAEAARPGARAVFEGLRYVATSPVLLMSFVVDIIAMVFALPRALYPELAATRFADVPGGAALALGWLNAAMAIGGVAAALLSGWVGRVRRQGLALIAVIALWGLVVAAAGLVEALWLVVFLMAVGGAADVVSSVWRQSILMLHAPDEMRGRMQGVFMVVVAGGPRLGDVRAGAMATASGLGVAWVGGGLACAVAVIAVGLSARRFRNYCSEIGK
ncbi:MFS transporter [Nonomuraea longicatena]|uniref:MFS transporter n=1 Tax=Nonomuraea longicatena TaxID=83682 RepID=A0ABP4BDI4_9ACTN